MKYAIDNNGAEVQVPIDTPVSTKDGVHYLLTPEAEEELATRNAIWESKAPERAVQAVIRKRVNEYGTAEEQLEFLVENGLQALIDRNTAIKQKYPKA